MSKSPSHPIAEAEVRVLKQSDIAACPFFIMIPSHYRPDGSCKCSNAAHRRMMILEWGYKISQFKNIALVD